MFRDRGRMRIHEGSEKPTAGAISESSFSRGTAAPLFVQPLIVSDFPPLLRAGDGQINLKTITAELGLQFREVGEDVGLTP